MLKIFLVEDSPLVRRRIAALIGAIKGVEIVGEAEDASDALSGIAAGEADVVIVDLRLTGGSGLDVLAGLAQSSRPVITIVLTNYSSAVIREACLAAGANYFFDKTSEFNLARDVIERIARARPATTTD
ncbi:response regulator transcription factor [Caballeronia mineralivorans]|jgi:DNA-binding NarL/FixJ family response regulator|uniref:response regulator n=1 Tax=Caballeronia mineralivorans TaxID=2010198 RepID=UPI0023F0EA8A|nr:response regulator transcription factor [Caballeronia mineralivorans]